MLMQADARALPLRDGCVQCVVTSPPYWGLRDYGIAGQIGLEATPEAYVATLVQVFREVRRVLKDDGTVWLVLGDSYAAGKLGRADTGPADIARRAALYGTGNGNGQGPREFRQRSAPDGLKPKDLVGIPWRVAFALQADGWYLRSDIIWHKPNPMPESVTDRPTKAHEYLFLLTKAARYFYDADAIAESSVTGVHTRDRLSTFKKSGVSGNHHQGASLVQCNGTRNKRSVWTIATRSYPEAHFATFPEALIEPCILAGSRPGDVVLDPFGGTATVVRVARRLNREGIACDLNPQYLALAEDRITEVQPSLLHVGA